jgi:uncharacterized integral membrane protein (TIGR00698 family)
MRLPGLLVALGGAAVALALGLVLPVVPVLTIALLLGLVVGQIPPLQPHLGGRLASGLATASRLLLRAGVVLLGFKLSVATIAGLGWLTIVLVVALVGVSFVVTWAFGRLFRLPGREALMMAAGFSICGVSAVGAMSAATRTRAQDTTTPIAMVTLFGSLGVFLLPLVARPLGLSPEQYGVWVGASLHDVGQVVAAGQAGGAAALAIAVTVKLTRVLTLAPMVAIASVVERRRTPDAAGGRRPPIVPLFIALFVVAVVVNSVVPLPDWFHSGTDLLQTVLFAMALFAIGAGIRLRALVRAGGRAALVGALSWAVICVLALGIVWSRTL